MKKTISYLKTRRRNCVQVLYKLILLGEDIERLTQEVLDGSQIEHQSEDTTNYLLGVLTNYNNTKELVIPLISSAWSWERLPNIIKAILISCTYEIAYKITEKSIVISEGIEMVREFLPVWDTAFINALLDKVN